MRIMKAVSVLALALVSGCGGCESCMGKPGAVEDAAPETVTATTASAKPVADAGAPSDASREAAAPAPTAITLLRDAAAPLLRPTELAKGMALGAFQSCGVYDGPLCEKKCEKGACRQECDGVQCLLTCAGGYCSQLCGIDGNCAMTCAGGHCVQACTKAEGCKKECGGGDCK